MADTGDVGHEKRRHDRFVVRLPVELAVGKKTSSGETVDVSFGGLFVHTSGPPPLRQLVKVGLRLPPKDTPISLMAMAVFVEEDSGRPDRGVGLQLFGLDPSSRERWETFVKHVRTLPRVEKVSEQRASLTPIEDEPPSWDRVRPEIRIQVHRVEDLQRILEREVARGRIYVRTPLYLEPGRHVELQIIHPRGGRTFVLLGEVDQKVERPGFEGLRILLPEPNPEELSAFRSFIADDRPPTIDLEMDAIGDMEMLERDEAS